MPEYRRSTMAGGTFFFTVVTYHRSPILTTAQAREILHSAWNNVNERFPFTTDSICLLPDHLHCIWTLPEEDADYSLRWGDIKKLFTKAYLKHIGPGETRNESRQKKAKPPSGSAGFGSTRSVIWMTIIVTWITSITIP